MTAYEQLNHRIDLCGIAAANCRHSGAHDMFIFWITTRETLVDKAKAFTVREAMR